MLWIFILSIVMLSYSGIKRTLSTVLGSANADQEWNLILVNQDNYIPDNYVIELTELSNGECIDSRIYPFLQDMFDHAREEGIYPIVRAGFRTHQVQSELLEKKIEAYKTEGYSDREAYNLAKEVVALPDTSEHQLGLAVDINADKSQSTNEEVYEWLAQNAHNFGFILRYPPDKKEITGTMYEPWHYRYVGKEVATKIHEQKICLEQYLQML